MADTIGKNRPRQIPCFTDEEIVTVDKLSEETEIGKATFFVPGSNFVRQEGGIHAYKTSYGTSVIQQQGLRGCPAGAASMLIQDHGKKVSITDLIRSNLGDDNTVIGMITNADLIHHYTPKLSLKELPQLLSAHGPAIVGIWDPILFGHYIIVDAIVDGKAWIRDPFHGWAITVTLEALKKRSPTSAIQIKEGTLPQVTS